MTHWSKTIPTEPGFYWLRDVRSSEAPLQVTRVGTNYRSYCDKAGAWTHGPRYPVFEIFGYEDDDMDQSYVKDYEFGPRIEPPPV